MLFLIYTFLPLCPLPFSWLCAGSPEGSFMLRIEDVRGSFDKLNRFLLLWRSLPFSTECCLRCSQRSQLPTPRPRFTVKKTFFLPSFFCPPPASIGLGRATKRRIMEVKALFFSFFPLLFFPQANLWFLSRATSLLNAPLHRIPRFSFPFHSPSFVNCSLRWSGVLTFKAVRCFSCVSPITRHRQQLACSFKRFPWSPPFCFGFFP